MTRRIISEPNFTSILSPAAPGAVSAKLEIVLAVLLAPMDPSKPYSTTKSEAPAIFGDMFPPALREVFWPFQGIWPSTPIWSTHPSRSAAATSPMAHRSRSGWRRRAG